MSDEINVKELLENSKEDFSSVVTVNATSYNVEDHWLRLASKYFNIDFDDNYSTSNKNSLSLLKTGLFGYINEISSHEIKNAVFHRNILYDEHFLNSASFPQSIYNFAKLYNVPVSTSHPAHMMVELIINKDELINNPIKTEILNSESISSTALKTYQLILNRNNEFGIEKFKYLLPYDVIINMKQINSNDYNITASYDFTSSKFPYEDEILSPYIKVYQEIVNGEKYIIFALDVYQMERSTQTFNIMSEDISDNLFYTTSFTNQLAYFNVYYTYKNETSLLNLYFNNTYNPTDSDEKYCYYSFLDNDKIQISFSSLPNSFRPRYNSIITVECMTTYGSEGNFSYKGEISFSISDINNNSFGKINATVVPLTDSANGSDSLTTTQMKQKIIKEIVTRDSLITDNDLSIFFTDLNNNNSVNESFIKFFKKQDDFLRRIYNSFLLMRESTKKVIPTNTAKYLYLSERNDDNNDYINKIPIISKNGSCVYPEFSIIRCKMRDTDNKDFIPTFEYVGNILTEEDRQRIVNDNVLPLKSTDPYYLYYICPFLIKIDKQPVLRASYFRMDYNNTVNVNYKYTNNKITTSLIVNKITIEKENNFNITNIKKTEEGVAKETYNILEKPLSENNIVISSDTYKISFTLNSDSPIDDIISNIKVRGILMSSKNNEVYGYFEFNRSKDLFNDPSLPDNLFEGRLSTDRTFNDSSKLNLKDSLYDKNGNVINNVFIEEDLILKVGILYKNENNSYTEYDEDITEINLFKDEFKKIWQDTGEHIKDYVLALSVECSESIYLYKNISDVMSSIVTRTLYNANTDKYEQVSVDYVAPNNKICEFKTELVPLVGMQYFLYNYEEIYKIINSYIKILETASSRLENNTEIDLKFYNTYGPTNHYYTENSNSSIDTENGDLMTNLGRTDILFDFKIHLYEEIDDTTDENIKQFISDYVEASNENDIIPVSNLIRLLETNFAVIKYIEYNGLSSDYQESLSNKYQKIKNIHTNFLEMTKQEIIEYVPEYINIKKNLKNYVVKNGDDMDINLGKKYEFIVNITYDYN